MGTWTAPALLDALKVALDARTGLASVLVGTALLGDETPPEAIVFVGVTGDQDPAALGRQRREDIYTIPGHIWVARPGAGEPAIKAARDRAAQILAELETELRENPTVDETIRIAQIASVGLEQGVTANNGRWAQINFTIACAARI